jgi:hypothetical protein
MGIGENDGQRSCGSCGLEIIGQAMKAKGQLYHDDKSCFKCLSCSKDLREVAVFSKEDSLYCEDHYKAKFVPKCAKCNDYITEVL